MAPMPRLLIIAFTALSLMAGAGQAQAGSPPAQAKEQQIRERLSALQVPFIKNEGQIDERVSFYAKTLTGTVFVTTQGEMVYALPEQSSWEGGEGTKISRTFVLTETLVNAKSAWVTGKERSATGVSYFIGNDRTKWKSRLPTYNTVSLGEVYEGITVTLKAHGKTVEKLFTVKPGADPREIRLALEGPRSIRINEQGELEAETESGIVTFTRPIAYQKIDGQRVEIAVDYEIDIQNPHLLYTFRLGPYDTTRALVIDPAIQSTYIGGSQNDWVNSMAIGPDGSVYVTGWTYSANFPGTAGGVQSSKLTTYETAFVSRLSADLTTFLQSTYLGSGYAVMAYAVAIGSDGSVYVAGKAWGGGRRAGDDRGSAAL